MNAKILILLFSISLFSTCIETKKLIKTTDPKKAKSSESPAQTGIKGGGMDFYKDGVSAVPDWKMPETSVEETEEGKPYEGTKHYKFTYTSTKDWKSMNLKIPEGSFDLSDATHLRFAYKTSPGTPPWRMVNLADGKSKANDAVPIEESEDYRVVEIPLSKFTKSKKLDLTSIIGFQVAVMGDGYEPGYIYVDDISFVKLDLDPAGGVSGKAAPLFKKPKGDLVIYSDNESQLNHVWHKTGVGLEGGEKEKGSAFEGSKYYMFDYEDLAGDWFGFSFYFPPVDTTKYEYISIAYKIEGDEDVYIALTVMSGDKKGSNPFELPLAPEYTILNIPIEELTDDSNADPSKIETIAFGFWDNQAIGKIYIDQIVFSKLPIKSDRAVKPGIVKTEKKAAAVPAVKASTFKVTDDDLIIYADDDSYIDYMWMMEDVGLEGDEVEEDNPFEGIAHYKITYKASPKWFGFNFSTGSGWDISDYKYLSIAYKTVGNKEEKVTLSLMTSKSERGKSFDLPYAPEYTVIHIPINDLIGGTKVDPTYINAITFGFNPPNEHPGTLYLDQIVFTSRNK